MRLLVHTIFYRPECVGVAKYTTELCEWLAAQGYSVHVIAPPPYYPQWRVQFAYCTTSYSRELIGGVDVTRCPIWIPRRLTMLGRFAYGVSFLLASAPVVLWKVLTAAGPILVIEPSFLNSLVSIVAAKLVGSNVHLHVQDFEIDLALRTRGLGWSKPLVSRVESWLLRRFDTVSTISMTMLARLEEKGVLRSRLRLLPNWFDQNVIFPTEGRLRDEIGVSSTSILVMFAGSLGAKQGADAIVHAARRLQSHTEIVFLICGDGPMKAALQKASAKLANIRFLPLQPTERLNDLLNSADLHLLPQDPSAADLVFPSKLIGMLATGRPVVACTNAGTEIARMVEGCGLIIEPGNNDALARAILNLAQDPQERRRLGKAARSRALQCFCKDSILPAWEETLFNLRKPTTVPHESGVPTQ